ncbi:MAG: hypothetical protein IAF58_23510, partial [Leptolyngbya sp.]|nr:hypothetical protein [Candidatus Melainabacteria bacterium]
IKLFFETHSLPTNVAGMMSFHRSGYVREAAVTVLSGRSDGDETAYLLLRMNDWVPVVSKIAIAAITRRATEVSGSTFIKNFTLVEQVKSTKRCELHEVMALIEQSIRSSQNRDALKEVISSSSHVLARSALSHFIASYESNSSDEDFLLGCLRNRDIQIRQNAIQAALKFLPARMDTEIRHITLDSAPSIRRMVLEHLKLSNTSGWKTIFRAALLDPNSGMRNFARYNLPEVNAEEIYLEELLKVDGNLEPALRGLLELGKQTPTAAVSRALAHPFAKIRAAGYAALFTTETPSNEIVTHMILNEKNICLKELEKFLKKKTFSISTETLTNLFRIASSASSRKIIVKLLANNSKWESFPILLEIKGSGNLDINSVVEAAIENWYRKFNKTFISPSQTELQNCKKAFEKFSSQLKTRQREDFEFFLKTQSTI